MRDQPKTGTEPELNPEEVEEGLAVTHIAQRHEITPSQAEALMKEHDAIRENLKKAVEESHAEKE